jgi:redox-sensitive bicupin YhaK (pirin superfamily)
MKPVALAPVTEPLKMISATLPRAIVLRTKGRAHGPILRLVSPGDLGELIKPFVFLDLFTLDARTPAKFGLHPHSGIATLTYLTSGEMHFLDRHGKAGSQAEGGIEWMMAGGGVWHGSPLTSPASARGFQLWIALPPLLENAESEELFLGRDNVPGAGPARVLLGEYDGVRGAVQAPSSMTYLAVTLHAGEAWTFTPPDGQTVAWIAVHSGALTAPEQVATGELVIFAEGNGSIRLSSDSGAGFVLGAAVKHPYDLVQGNYSVHTSAAALADGETKIKALGVALGQS